MTSTRGLLFLEPAHVRKVEVFQMEIQEIITKMMTDMY